MNLLKDWLMRVFKDKTWYKFDDYHIPDLLQINDSSEWIKKIFEKLDDAVSLNNELSTGLIIVLGISLKSGRRYRGVTFKDGDDIMKEANESPPSIYAFSEDFDYLKMTVEKSLWIENLKDVPTDVLMLYLEYRANADNEFRRSILFIKKNDLTRITLSDRGKSF